LTDATPPTRPDEALTPPARLDADPENGGGAAALAAATADVPEDRHVELDQSPPDQSAALSIRKLRHAFRRHVAVENASFDVKRQSIHGFVGPNGAGKTTTLKIIATLLPPQVGQVYVLGRHIRRDIRTVRQRLGFMPDHFSMYRQMTVFEYLDFFGAAYGLPTAKRTSTINDVLDLTDMAGRRDELIHRLSRGMQQRVSLARVLVHDPDLLLLDEPASGLDPRARIELMEILRELRRLGKTIFISSHILSELAELCDSVTIIDRGAVRYSGPMDALLEHSTDALNYVLRLREPCPPVAASVEQVAGVTAVETLEGETQFRIGVDPAEVEINAVLRAAMDAGGVVDRFEKGTRHLNEAFMDLTKPGVRT